MGRCGLWIAIAAVWFGFAVPALADNRVALVIGNGAYLHVPHLPNPSNDADDVAAALKRTGFQTIVGKDLDQFGMQDVVIKFARAARTADVAVFYYSGHAMQYGGVNYLFPVDAQLSDEADLVRMSRVDDILANLKQAKNLRILVLDACRNNPFAEQLKETIGTTRGASIERGLARMQSQDGTIISYSTQAGRTANDGDGRNSPYTSAFLGISRTRKTSPPSFIVSAPASMKVPKERKFRSCRCLISANFTSTAICRPLLLRRLRPHRLILAHSSVITGKVRKPSGPLMPIKITLHDFRTVLLQDWRKLGLQA